MNPSDSPLLMQRAVYNQKEPDYSRDDDDYNAALDSQFSLDWKNHTLENDWFWGKSIDEFMERNESDGIAQPYPTRKDTWRNNTRRMTIVEKVDAVLAAVADLNLQPELWSYDIWGNESKGAAEALEVLLSHADGLNLTELKDKWSVRYMLVHGTVAETCSWMSMKKLIKTGKLNQETGEWKGSEREGRDIEKVWTQTHPLNRVVLADRTQPIISLQPHIWKLTVMPYETAEAYFKNWKNWDSVIPIYGTPSDEWTSLVKQQQVEETGDSRLVRMVEYEDRWKNEYALKLNGVLMTKRGTPLPGTGDYSVTWTQLFPPSPHWAYGMSFVQRMRRDAVLLDFFYNALVDKQRQGLEPPLVSSYRSILNRNMFRPGNITQGDIQVKPLITHNGVTSADLEMARYIEENLDKASTPPIFGGQSSSAQTAFEIREQMRSALRAMWNVFSSVAEMKRQRTEAMLRLILEHYPSMGVGKLKSKVSDAVGGIKMVFSTQGTIGKGMETGTKAVSFGKMDNPAKALSAMMKEEDESKAAGLPLRQIIVDPETIKEMRHVVQVIVNPADRKSKKADKQEIKDEYAMYVGNPVFDQAWAAKLLLTSLGRDPEEAIAKAPESPEMPPGWQGAPQMGNQPSQPEQAPLGAVSRNEPVDTAQNSQNKMASMMGV